MAPKAAPKPQVFNAPDGKEFGTQAEWRDYMMQTFYSWNNLSNEPAPLIKYPGEIDGNVFDISDCVDCTLVIMDTTEAVQIDGLTMCRVFIGCCVSSIFIRNCTNCVFYTCCRQLRLREVTASTLYVYSQAEVHIEQSSALQFAPFNGGYAEQAAHFAASGLQPVDNLWWDIFDHNDPDKARTNWQLLDPEKYEQAWFPSGSACTPCVPVTAPGLLQGQDAGKEEGQVGQAFGMEQMMADAERVKQEATQAAVQGLTMEVALLVASALGKGINVSLWLTEGAGREGRQPFADFKAKLVSLGLMVGVEEDWDTKRELELATSKSSLRKILEACGRGRDKAGRDLVDVGLFITAAQEKVAAYLLAAEGDGELLDASSDGRSDTVTNGDVAESDQYVYEASRQLEQSGGPSGTLAPSPSPASAGAAGQGSADRHSRADRAAAPQTEAYGRPASAGTSRADLKFAATTSPSPFSFSSPSSPSSHNPNPNRGGRGGPATPIIVRGSEVTEAIIPDSPYDEEVAFDLEGEEEVDTVMDAAARGYADGARGRAEAGESSRDARGQGYELPPHRQSGEREQERQGRVSPGAAPPAPRPRPSSAGPRPAPTSRRGPAAAALFSSQPQAQAVRRSVSAGTSRASAARSSMFVTAAPHRLG